MKKSLIKNAVTLEYQVPHSDQQFTYSNWWYGNRSRETYVARAGAELSNFLRLSRIEALSVEFKSFEAWVETDTGERIPVLEET